MSLLAPDLLHILTRFATVIVAVGGHRVARTPTFGQLGQMASSGSTPDRLSDDKINLSLVQAHLASLLDGLDFGHIHPRAGKAVRDGFDAELRQRGFHDASGTPTGQPLTPRDAWAALGAALLNAGELYDTAVGRPNVLADRRSPSPVYKNAILVSIGPINYHVDLIREGARSIDPALRWVSQSQILDRRRDLRFLERCARSLNEGLKSPAAALAYLKGSADRIVWLAPQMERVAKLVDQRIGSCLPQSATDQLRDLLGLWAENGRAPRPLALFRCVHQALYAPNVLTAKAYERFRHRPRRRLASAPTAGLTYNLDPRLARRFPGSCELVAVGVTMSQVTDILACGMPSRMSSARAKVVAAHVKYAETVRAGRSWQTIMTRLDELTA